MRRALLTCLLVLGLTSTASARVGTDLVMPDGQARDLYTSWIAQSLVPTAPVKVILNSASCATSEGKMACTHIRQRPMSMDMVNLAYLWKPDPAYQSTDSDKARTLVQFVFMHEMGHVRDYSFTRHAYRAKFLRIMGISVDPGRWRVGWRGLQVVRPDEQFAQGYAFCAIYPTMPDPATRALLHEYGYDPSPSQYAQVCDLMRNLGRSA